MKRLLHKKEVETLMNMGYDSLRYQIRKGQFPAPIKLTQKKIAWREEDIEEYLNSRPRATYRDLIE
jgi:prophage regulatory protein